MTRAHHDVRIDRPIEEVFDFLADGANNPRWQAFIVATTPPAGPVGAGSTFCQRARHPLGSRVSADYRITAYERPAHLAIVAASGGPVRPAVSYDLTPAGEEATMVRCTVEYRPPDRSGAGAVITPSARRSRDRAPGRRR